MFYVDTLTRLPWLLTVLRSKKNGDYYVFLCGRSLYQYCDYSAGEVFFEKILESTCDKTYSRTGAIDDAKRGCELDEHCIGFGSEQCQDSSFYLCTSFTPGAPSLTESCWYIKNIGNINETCYLKF